MDTDGFGLANDDDDSGVELATFLFTTTSFVQNVVDVSGGGVVGGGNDFVAYIILDFDFEFKFCFHNFY